MRGIPLNFAWISQQALYSSFPNNAGLAWDD